MTAIHEGRRSDLTAARRLSAISVVLGGVVAIGALAAGLAVGSLSTVGFGLDAAIDATASIVLWWRFATEESDPARAVRVEALAERAIGIVMLVSAAALVLGAVHGLLAHSISDTSTAQIALLVVSVVALPPLAFAKRRIALRLSSNALAKDALLTAAGAFLAFVALVASALAPALGLWWADSAGSVVIAVVLGREGSTIVFRRSTG
jgi:divalent metal cation (Fe/Co/Zn/Cd) transporter